MTKKDTASHRTPPSRRQFIQGAGVVTGGLLGHSLAPSPLAAGGRATAIQETSSSPGTRFRQLLARAEPSACINVHDVATAKLAQMHGFEMIMSGGSALALSQFGFGDFGMLTISDLIDFCARTADAVDTPIIADADDGGGNPLTVYRSVQRFEKAGAACIMIQDLYGAKNLRGFSLGNILDRAAMIDKVHAAVDARRDQDTVILVRSDVQAAGGSLDEALERVSAYAEAGGEVIFVPGIPLDQCPRAVEMAQRPIISYGAPSMEAARQNRVGIMWVGSMLGIALGAMDRAMRELKDAGRIQDSNDIALSGPATAMLTGNEMAVEQAKRYNALR